MDAHDNQPTEQSTSHRVKRSMVSMLIGRPISALGGLLVLVLLSRLLPKEEYGVYFALWALVEIAILLSDPGVLHLIYRFVNASSNADGQIMPKGPVLPLLLIRCSALAVGALVILVLPAEALDFFKLVASPKLLVAVSIIMFFEGAARGIEAVFDSMLCQGASQISTVARTLIRLFGIFISVSGGDGLTLERLIWIDFCATIFGACLCVLLLLRIYIRRRHYGGNVANVSIPKKTLLYYAVPAYLSQVLGICFSVDMLKLTLASTSSVYQLAVFGFVFSMTLVVQRYLPANLFSGIFRPLFISASKKADHEKMMVELMVACIKMNWIFLVPLVCFSYVLGDFMLDIISNGNYKGAGSILTVSVVGLMAFSTHLVLSHLCLAKQTPWPLLLANLCATFGLLVGIVLGMHWGALGAAIAFGINELIWSAACFCFIFGKGNFLPYADLTGLMRLIIVGLIAVVTASSLTFVIGDHPIIISALLIVPVAFGILRCGVFTGQEGQWLMAVIPMGHKLPLILKFRSDAASI